MAGSKLSIVCLSFLLLYKFIDCETCGDLSEALESNVKVAINQSPSATPIIRNITTKSQNTIAATLEIPKFIEYQGRIVKSAPKPGATAVKTIKYRLGKRVAGK